MWEIQMLVQEMLPGIHPPIPLTHLFSLTFSQSSMVLTNPSLLSPLARPIPGPIPCTEVDAQGWRPGFALQKLASDLVTSNTGWRLERASREPHHQDGWQSGWGGWAASS